MSKVDIYTERQKDGIYLEIREIKPLAWICMPDTMAKNVIGNLEKLLKTKYKKSK